MTSHEVSTRGPSFCDDCLVPELINRYITSLSSDPDDTIGLRGNIIMAEQSLRDIGEVAVRIGCRDIPKVLPSSPAKDASREELLRCFRACSAYGKYRAGHCQDAGDTVQ